MLYDLVSAMQLFLLFVRCTDAGRGTNVRRRTSGNLSVFLFYFLADAHVLAQALDKLGKSGKGLPGEDFEEAGVSTRIAREVVVVRFLLFALLAHRGIVLCLHAPVEGIRTPI